MWFVATCPGLTLLNGRVHYTQSEVGEQYLESTRASFRCDKGYSLHGDVSTTCQTSGSWSHQTPTCRGNVFYIMDACIATTN